jgi:hypothetical protein
MKKGSSAALPYLLAKPNLDQRLVGHVAFVGDLDLLQEAYREPERDRCRARLKVAQLKRSAGRRSRAAV